MNFKPLQENANHIPVVNNKLLKAQLLLVLIGIYKANRSYFIKWPIIWFDDNFITKLMKNCAICFKITDRVPYNMI